MPFKPSQKEMFSLSKLNYGSSEKEDLQLKKKVENFISSIFQSVEEEIHKENEVVLVSKFISSLFEDARNDFLISKFIDSVLNDAKREVDKIKSKFNITRNMQEQDSQKEKNICESPNMNNNIKVENPHSIKSNEEKTKNTCAKCDNDMSSSLKGRKVLFSGNQLPAISNVNTFHEEKTEVNRFTSKSSFKNKRNYSTNKKDLRDNKKSNSHKSHLSVQFRTRTYKEKSQDQEKMEIMKNQMSLMKRRKEEMDNKKQKAILKKALKSNIYKNKSELNKVSQDKVKNKDEINPMKKSSGKLKLIKIKKYHEVKEEKKKLDNKMKTIRQENNNVKRLIQKIRVLRAFNRNMIPKEKNIINNKVKIIAKECGKNLENTYFQKKQIRLLKNEKNKYGDKLNRTREKLFNYNIVEKAYSTATFKSNKKGKSYKPNW
jgi:hypothetical protein